MSKYRAVVHKILEDGTEVEIMRCQDDPWYVATTMTEWAKRLKRIPQDLPVFPGQTSVSVTGEGKLIFNDGREAA